MKNLLLPAFLALVASCAVVDTPAPVVKLPAPVWVISSSNGSYGSCCPVRVWQGRTWFVTARHCTDGTLSVGSCLEEDPGTPARLEWSHDEEDIALVSAPVEVSAVWSLRATPPVRGERLYSAGYPRCRPLTIYEGLALQYGRASCQVGPGMSGGPVFDAHGRLVGVNSLLEPPATRPFFIRWGVGLRYARVTFLPLAH